MTGDALYRGLGFFESGVAQSRSGLFAHRSGSEVARLIFIVARDLPQLHDYLVQRFSTIQDVRVILDRRQRERRRRGEAHGQERRQDERRRQPNIDEELRSRGFAITHPREPEAAN